MACETKYTPWINSLYCFIYDSIGLVFFTVFTHRSINDNGIIVLLHDPVLAQLQLLSWVMLISGSNVVVAVSLWFDLAHFVSSSLLICQQPHCFLVLLCTCDTWMKWTALYQVCWKTKLSMHTVSQFWYFVWLIIKVPIYFLFQWF